MTSQLTAPELQAALTRKEAPVVIDVREPAKYSRRHIPGAEHMPLAELVSSIKQRHPNRDEPVVVYSDHGILSQHAATLLRSIGYHNVSDLAGGILGFGEIA
jgi:rhodanese-related sulfurtransferase